MELPWNQKTRKGLLVNMAMALFLAVAANGFIFLVNPAAVESSADVPMRRVRGEPPGYVIGIVWIFLFLALGAARWSVSREAGKWVVLLLLACLAYPLYTAGLKSVEVGFFGDLATGALAIWVSHRILRESRRASALVAVVAAWLSFASWLTWQQCQRLQ